MTFIPRSSFQCSIAEVQLAKSIGSDTLKLLTYLLIVVGKATNTWQSFTSGQIGHSSEVNTIRKDQSRQKSMRHRRTDRAFLARRSVNTEKGSAAGVYLLNILGPLCRFRHGHEATVGQNSAHYEKTK